VKSEKLGKFSAGWFVGDFEKAIYRTKNTDVAVKYDAAGTRTTAHVHRVSAEVTVVVKGRIQINGREFGKGDVILVSPGEAAEYVSLEDSITVIIKVPSLPHDKYPVESTDKEETRF